MNKVILMGRLTRDPEIRYSNAAEPLAIVRYALAVDRRVSRERASAGEPTADFINCTAFGKAGEFVEKFFRKGQMVSVIGRLTVNSYTDNTGQRRWSTEVITDEHFFAESRASFESRMQNQPQGAGFEAGPDSGAGSGNNYNDNNFAPQPPQQIYNRQPRGSSSPHVDPSFFAPNDSDDLDDEDLPF